MHRCRQGLWQIKLSTGTTPLPGCEGIAVYLGGGHQQLKQTGWITFYNWVTNKHGVICTVQWQQSTNFDERKDALLSKCPATQDLLLFSATLYLWDWVKWTEQWMTKTDRKTLLQCHSLRSPLTDIKSGPKSDTRFNFAITSVNVHQF